MWRRREAFRRNDLHLDLIVCEALAAGGDDTIHAIREVPAYVRARADLVTTPAAVLGLVDGEVAKARPSAAGPIRTRRELEAGLINLSQSIGFVEQAIKHSGVVAMAVG